MSEPTPKALSSSLPREHVHLSSHHHTFKSAYHENKQLKKQNELLRRELDNISIRLDWEIKKRHEDGNRKPWSKPEDVVNKQLENAHKQCQIYKRQASFYRKKVDLYSDSGQLQQFQSRISELQQENRQLGQQIVYLKKIIKKQEKGLEQLGVQGYLDMTVQKQQLQAEVKQLKKQLCEYRRTYKAEPTNKEGQISQIRRSTNLTVGIHDRNKPRLKSEPAQQQSNRTSSVALQEKEMQRLRTVTSERDKLQEQVSRFKEANIEKDKEIRSLKAKIDNLRKNNKQLQSKTCSNKQMIEAELSVQRQDRSRLASRQRVWINSTPQTKSVEKIIVPEEVITEKGTQWSHQAFKSKIIQLQFLLHPKGHIRDLHARYEKGEPRQYKINDKNIYESLVCRTGQYIQQITVYHQHGYLQTVMVVTSDKRSQTFGNSSIGSAEMVTYGQDGIDFPGALFGETTAEGITRLGCIMMKG